MQQVYPRKAQKRTMQTRYTPYCRVVTDPETGKELVIATIVKWPAGTIQGSGIGETHKEAIEAARDRSRGNPLKVPPGFPGDI